MKISNDDKKLFLSLNISKKLFCLIAKLHKMFYCF